MVPMLKIVIGDDAPDNSVIPQGLMRELPPLPSNWQNLMDNRLIFEVERGAGGGEIEWLINGVEFNPAGPATSLRNPARKTPLAQQKKGSFNLWEIRNGGGGWVHPFHLHMEEHRTVMRNGKIETSVADPGHPEDISQGGPGGARSGRVDDHLPRLPRLRRPVRGALPQPGPRGPRHDVRLGNHAVIKRLQVSWTTVVSLVVLIACADAFWATTVQGAVGATAESQTPFVHWLRDSVLMLVPFTLAVLAALALTRRWVVRGHSEIVQLAVAALLLVVITAGVGIAQVSATAARDYRIQVTGIGVTHSLHGTPVVQERHDHRRRNEDRLHRSVRGAAPDVDDARTRCRATRVWCCCSPTSCWWCGCWLYVVAGCGRAVLGSVSQISR